MPLRCFQPRTFLKYPSLPFAFFLCLSFSLETQKRMCQSNTDREMSKKEMTAVWEWKPNTKKIEMKTKTTWIPCSYSHFSVEFSIHFFSLWLSLFNAFTNFKAFFSLVSTLFVWPKNRLMFQIVFIFSFEVTGPMKLFFSFSLLLTFQMDNSCSWKQFFFRITLFWCSYLRPLLWE